MECYNNYKDCGIYYLPLLPSDWQILRAKYLFKQEQRPVRDSDEIITCFRDGQVTLRRNRRIDGFTNSLKEIGYQGVRRGDLVIHNMDAFAGAIGISDSDGKATPVYSCCTPLLESIDSYYYCFFLRYLAKSNFILSLAKGIRERSTDFRFSDFKKLYLPVPSYSEQQAIVDYLDKETGKLDAAVEKLERMVDVLKERKQLIISKAVTRGLDDSVPLKDSGVECIGQIPKHWQELKIKFCLENKPNNIKVGPFGSDLKSSDYSITGYWVYNQRTVLDQNFTSNEIFVNKKKFQQLSAFEVFPGDFLITTRGTIGKVAIVPDNYFKGILHPCIIRFRVDDRILNKYYLRYIFNGSDVVINQILSKSNATTIDAIYSSSLKDIKVTIPEYNEQCAIVAYLDEETGKLDAAVEKLERMIELLKERKQILISDVVTGKIKVA